MKSSDRSAPDQSTLKTQYDQHAPTAREFAKVLTGEIETVLKERQITPALPVHWRVKQWESIEDKIVRKDLKIENVLDLQDLTGLRIVLHFEREVAPVCASLTEVFSVIQQQRKGEALAAEEFGYQSTHLTVKLPDHWASVPSMKPYSSLMAEIQIRTVAQHAWAAASAILQYKQKGSVPPAIVRSLSRVSALLEMVDLEFERVLVERAEYRAQIADLRDSELLNVDILEKVLDSIWPMENKSEHEPYALLLYEITKRGIKTATELKSFIQPRYKAVMKEERERSGQSDVPERLARGVYFTHTGLTRMAMFGL